MINFKFRKFIKEIRKISLSNDEKATLRSEFLAKAGFQNQEVKSVRAFPFIFSRKFEVAFAAVLVFVCSSTAVAYAANNTLPGDILYKIKTNVEEPIVRAFYAGSPSKAADYEVDLVHTRLTEAEDLIKNNSLTPEKKEQVRSSILEQTQKAESSIKLLEKKNNNVNIKSSTTPEVPEYKQLQKVLEKHQEVLLKINANFENKKDPNSEKDKKEDHGGESNKDNKVIKGNLLK